jgi:hypothetical protein
MLDAMRIYGDDLAYLFAEVCKDDIKDLLTVIWAFEVGINESQLNKEVPPFASLEYIKNAISEARSMKDVKYPFDEARQFIEKKSPVRF